MRRLVVVKHLTEEKIMQKLFQTLTFQRRVSKPFYITSFCWLGIYFRVCHELKVFTSNLDMSTCRYKLNINKKLKCHVNDHKKKRTPFLVKNVLSLHTTPIKTRQKITFIIRQTAGQKLHYLGLQCNAFFSMTGCLFFSKNS